MQAVLHQIGNGAIAGIAAIDWRGTITGVWGWASAHAATGYAFALGLPASWKMATIHTALVCSGQTPEYVSIPGFVPLSYSWGWLLVGTVLGAVITLLLLALTGRLRREPTVGALAAIAHAPPAQRAPPGLVPPGILRTRQEILGFGDPQNRAREDILAYLAAGGGPALQELAAAAGVSENQFLAAAFGRRL